MIPIIGPSNGRDALGQIVDMPLGWKLLGRERHTGGFFTRTELSGGAAEGLKENQVYSVDGRFVVDFPGKVWKMHWLSLGASYFSGDHVSGWSTGVDVRFQF